LSLHRGHVPFSHPLLTPLSFQTPAFILPNPFLIFLEQSSITLSYPISISSVGKILMTSFQT
jgi:hypothetical protein